MREQDPRPRILIVETDREYALILEARIARRFGNSHTEITGSPEQALAAVEQHSFDVAVVDFDRAIFDGVALVKDLCRRRADMSVIVVADELTDGLVRELFRIGCDELLIKDSTFYNVVPHLIYGLFRRRASKTVTSSKPAPPVSMPQPRLSPEVLGHLSDEITNPLSDILRAAQEILQGAAADQPSLRQRMEHIEQSARRIRDFVDGVSSLRSRTSLEHLSGTDKPGEKA